MRAAKILALVALGATACAGSDAASSRPSEPGLVGRVTDAATGLPVRNAYVRSPAHHNAGSDSTGRFGATLLHPDSTHSMVTVTRLGYAPASIDVAVRPGRLDMLDVALQPAAPVRLRIDGRWRIRFEPLADKRCRAVETSSRTPVEAAIAFDPALRDTTDWLDFTRDRQVWSVYGHMRLDMGALLHSRPGTSDASGSQYLDTPSPPPGWEVMAQSFDGDSVEMGLLSNGSHFGVAFAGRARGDSVVGRWAYYDPQDCYPRGRAVMWRER